MLDRIFDRILSDEEKKHPLRLPPEHLYRFAVEDSDSNIAFDKDNGNQFLIKGATLLKLVERLTHHQHSDPHFINTFLTTYRSFCSPDEFLDLLIERYNIPEQKCDAEEIESIHERKMLKRFQKEYARHVKLRVLNVIKQWVIHHFYDFERDPSLQIRLEKFLVSAEGKNSNSILESVRRCLKKAVENSANSSLDLDRSFHSASRSPPPIEYHIQCPFEEWNILTIHPFEFARQLTLVEFDLYRVVKPSELVGSVWTKEDKEQSSPNLLKMIKHTTNVTRWFEKTIVETENLTERVAVVSRILEIMVVLQELNNFNGVLAVISTMGSASVHRLQHTLQQIHPRLLKALEQAQDLQNDHYRKYQQRLRSINPPCVPFFGMYLTNILHIEEGNSDFLKDKDQEKTDLINFSKRRRVAEITAEIRQFQYSHYCLSPEPKIQQFIKNLQPFNPNMPEKDISDELFNKSSEIEPRNSIPPKFPRKWPSSYLKSPGIKPKNLPGKSHPLPLNLPGPSSSPSIMSIPAALHRNANLNHEDGQESLSQTPKNLTPSSVKSATSPLHQGDSENSIFVPAMIGAMLPNVNPPAPPLPPRSKKGNFAVESPSPNMRDSSCPPPLPPRIRNPPTSSRTSTPSSSSKISPSNIAPQSSISPDQRLTESPSDGHLLNNSSNGNFTNGGAEHSRIHHHQHLTHSRVANATISQQYSQIPPQLPPRTRPTNNINASHNTLS